MKKDLTKYYVEVTEKDAKKLAKIMNNPFVSEKSIIYSIKIGLNILHNNGGCFKLNGWNPGKKKISLKTLTNYIAYNSQVDRSFVEPIGLKKLTEKVSRQREAIEIYNDKLNKQLDLNDKLKRENYAKTSVIAILAFTLLISWIFITQKL